MTGAREVTNDGWGKTMLEEVLFRAAEGLGESQAAPGPSLEVSVVVTITANLDDAVIEVAFDTIDGPTATRLKHPF